MSHVTDLRAERDLRWKVHRVKDQATVDLMLLTGDPMATIVAADAERRREPAYDALPVGQPRDRVLRCPVCDAAFVAIPNQTVCSRRCWNRRAQAQWRARRVTA